MLFQFLLCVKCLATVFAGKVFFAGVVLQVRVQITRATEPFVTHFTDKWPFAIVHLKKIIIVCGLKITVHNVVIPKIIFHFCMQYRDDRTEFRRSTSVLERVEMNNTWK